MKYLDILINEDGKAELKRLLDEHSVTWHESKVMRFSVSFEDVVKYL